jgi:hypothetical protein
MPDYSYTRCLQRAYRIAWKIEDVLGGREFDPALRWLPLRLSGASRTERLSPEESLLLTQVEMAAYAHIFAYVEEFIAPKVSSLAGDFALEQRDAFDALTNFAAEEVKHMNLFRQLRERVDRTLGFETRLVGGQAETARFVLSKSDAAVLLLTACIEWFTQLHFVEAFQDDPGLDELTRSVFKAHWLEESQHAQLDHLETLRAFARMGATERDRAIDELIELVAGVDGLLQAQVALDLDNFATRLGRELGPAERKELQAALLAAKRYTFLETGVTHPRFQELFLEVSTPAQRERVERALAPILAPEPQPA